MGSEVHTNLILTVKILVTAGTSPLVAALSLQEITPKN